MGGGPSKEPAPLPEASKEEAKMTTATPILDASKTNEEPARSFSRSMPEVPKGREETSREPAAKSNKVPHMYQAIIEQADDPSDGNLLDKIRSSGIFLNHKKQKYWVEEKTGYSCFMVFARGLSITWSENQQFWNWVSLQENSDVEIEIARLLDVCWLEVHGRFETSYLTPGVLYEVVFMVFMELGYGWNKPVNLRLKFPNGVVKRREECLLDIPQGKWTELKAGEFVAESNRGGEMEFSLYEYDDGQWKRGLVIKGAIIQPKK